MQWFPPSMSSVFRDLLPSSGAAQPPAALRAAEASTQAVVVEAPAPTAAPRPMSVEESAADSADLTRLLETVRCAWCL